MQCVYQRVRSFLIKNRYIHIKKNKTLRCTHQLAHYKMREAYLSTQNCFVNVIDKFLKFNKSI